MAQRCPYCGKTEKQHKGIACLDLSIVAQRLQHQLPQPTKKKPNVIK